MARHSWGTFLKKRGIQTNIAPELIRRGWELFDYREPTHEEESFMSHACHWTGIAVHPDAPDTVLCVWVSEHDVEDSSGKPVYDLSGLPKLPENTVLPFNLPQFPTFQANPKGYGWHIEKGGAILHKGKFHRDCDKLHEFQYRAPIEVVVDKIEQLALGRMVINAKPAPVKLPVSERPTPPRHTITLGCRGTGKVRSRVSLRMRGARVYERGADYWRTLWGISEDDSILYDLYSGQGGAGWGYKQAGFKVVGIDRNPQSGYPCDAFLQMDALEFLRRYLLGEFPEAAVFHASPPCQFGTQLNHLHKHKPEYHEKHVNMIPQTRELLKLTGKAYVIENVPGARKHLIDPVMLCGKSFGLKVYRHRYFECSFFMLVPPHWKHQDKTPRAGGGCSPKGFVTVAGHGGVKYLPPDFNGGFREYAGMAMEIDWMTREGLSQAIPPAYTEFIGKHLMTAFKHTRQQPEEVGVC